MASGDYLLGVSALGKGGMKNCDRQAESRADLTWALHKIKARLSSRSRWMIGVNLAQTAVITVRR